MGFLNDLGSALNDAAERSKGRTLDAYKQKLRTATDECVRRKWEQVNDGNYDESVIEITENEMRKRGLM